MHATQIEPNGSATPVATPAQVHIADSSRRLASLLGRIMGVVLLAAAVNLAVGGALAGIRFHLFGNELSLSFLVGPPSH